MADLTTQGPPQRRAHLEDLRVLIGRMDGKLDFTIHTLQSHEPRIRSLETWRDQQKGALWGWILGGGFLGGVAADQIISLLFP